MNKLKLISLLCTIAMLIGCFAMFPAFAADTPTTVNAVGNGSGTDNDPYKLYQSNFDDYYTNFSTYASKHVKLMENIYVNTEGSASDWKTGTRPANVWTGPMGGGTMTLSGGFDGNNFTISGVCLIGPEGNGNDGSWRRVGLFANVSGTLKNLKLVNSYFEGNACADSNYDEVAAFAPRFSGTISNCYTDAILVNNDLGTTQMVTGGLAGKADGGTITDSVFAGSITSNGNKMVGGILGWANVAVTISNCVNAGSVNTTVTDNSGSYRPGGILGHNSANGTKITNCLNTGAVTQSGGYSISGGIVGNTTTSKDLTIENSMNLSGAPTSAIYSGTGWVQNRDTIVRNQIVVTDLANQKLDNSGYTADTAATTLATTDANETAYQVIKATMADLKTADVVADGGLLEGWTFTSSAYVPTPNDLIKIEWASFFKYWEQGDNTEGTWYTLDQNNFQAFWLYSKTNQPKGNYMLAGDVTVNVGKATEWADGTSTPANVWDAPIGNTSNFEKVFDGNGYTISGIYMKTSGNTQTGLFYRIYGTAVVKNLRIENSYFASQATSGNSEMGSIAGRVYNGTKIENCYSNAILANVSGATSAAADVSIGGIAGGILGGGDTAYIKDCTFAGEIRSSIGSTGGILGYTHVNVTNAEISGCTFNGKILDSMAHTGGIAGRISGATPTITIKNCVNNGSVIGIGADNPYRPGGIVGYVGVAGVTVKDCLNVGSVTNAGTAQYKVSGGIVGDTATNTLLTIENCMNLSNDVTSAIHAGSGWVEDKNVIVKNQFVISSVSDKQLDNSGYSSDTAANTLATNDAGETEYQVVKIDLIDFLNGTALAGWVREDGYLPAPNAHAKIDISGYLTAASIGLDSTGEVHSVRISSENSGLRFETKVDKDAIEALRESGATVTMTTYITLAEFVDSKATFIDIIENGTHAYIAVPATEYLRENGVDGWTGDTTFAGSVTDITDYTRVYTAIGCITVTVDGNSYDIYANYDAGEIANIEGIALIAARDTKATAETGYTNYIEDMYGEWVYSPYTQANYDSILAFIGDRDNAVLDYVNGQANFEVTSTLKKESTDVVTQATNAAADNNITWSSWATQGGCVVGDKIYVCEWSNNRTAGDPVYCVIVELDLNGNVIRKSAPLSLGHGNDMTYNGTELVVASCDGTNEVYFIETTNLTLVEAKTEKLDVTPVAIDYVDGQYVVGAVQNSYLYIYDSEFNLVRTVKSTGVTPKYMGGTVHDYAMQGMFTDGVYAYVLEWHGGSTAWENTGGSADIDNAKSNLIVVDLATGQLIEKIDLGIGNEVEFVDYVDGTFYIGCNNNNWSGMKLFTATVDQQA